MQTSPPAPPAATEIRVERAQYHLLVPVDVEGQAYWFIVDSGAAASVIDLGLARLLGWPLGQSFDAGGAGGGSVAGAVLPRTVGVSVAGVVPHTLVAALDLSGLTSAEGRPLAGILGGDFLRRFVVEINYQAPAIRLHDPAERIQTANQLPLTFQIGHPHLTGSVGLPDGRELALDFVVDLGSNLAVGITQPVVEREHLNAAIRPRIRYPVGRGIGGAAEAGVGLLASLRLGVSQLTEVPVALFGEGAGVLTTGAYFEANLGGAVLSRFTVFLDYGRSLIGLEPNAQSGPIEFDSSGLILGLAEDGEVMVSSVIPASPATDAGLAIGDRIVAVGPEPVTAQGLDRLRTMLRKPGLAVQLRIRNRGAERTVTLTTRSLLGQKAR